MAKEILTIRPGKQHRCGSCGSFRLKICANASRSNPTCAFAEQIVSPMDGDGRGSPGFNPSRLAFTWSVCDNRCPLWVISGRVTGPRENPLWQGKRTWAGEESLQTDLQTNHATRHGIEHHRIGWS